MSQAILHIGLDVHAQTITIAIAEGTGEARLYGTISSDLHSVDKFLAKLRKAHPDAVLRWCYEAGPTGFVLQRHIGRKGMECLVAAPSLIPGRSGDRIKTDKRDAVKLARLLRAGELTGVHVPDAVDEAMRDLCRARTDAVQDQRRLRMQLKAFLLRSGYRYQGKTSWNEKHLSYLRGLTLPHAAQKAVLEDTVQSLDRACERIVRLEQSMEALLEDWGLKPVVRAVMGLRGFALIGAMVIVSELGGAWRFEHPRQLMAYLGLVPTEPSRGPGGEMDAAKRSPQGGCGGRSRSHQSSSGGKRSQGAISKTGNSHARWIMIEASHHYRLAPGISPQMSQRQEGLSQAVKDCAWKAQTRLHQRLRQLLARGKNRNKAQVAVARELCGFIWEIFRIMHREMTRAEAAPKTTTKLAGPNRRPMPKRATTVPA